MALVSPGLEITVTDESQYLPSAVGTIPFVLVATAENKVINGTVAPGTIKSNLGKIYGISSQRELAANFGLPRFRRSSAGTPLHGNELNEYGLMAAYSALGLGNRIWVVRADVDLDDLVGTTVRPIGESPDGTIWFDTGSTEFGLFEYNSDSNTFSKVTPRIIDNTADCVPGTTQPRSSIGSIGEYAVIVFDSNNYVYYKDSTNTWVPVGDSVQWSDSIPVVKSTTSSVNIPAGSEFVLNGQTFVVQNDITSMSVLAQTLNQAVTGVTASVNSAGRLEVFADPTATNGTLTGVCEFGASTIADVTAGNFVAGRSYTITVVGTTDFTLIGAASNTVGTAFVATGVGAGTGEAAPDVENDLSSVGISNIVYGKATISYGSYASVPAWSAFDPVARPTGSIWVKTSAQGGGANFIVKKYSSSLSSWNTLATPLYASGHEALFRLDATGGGAGIAAGSAFVKYDTSNTNGRVSFAIYTLSSKGQTKVTGTTVPSSSTFRSGDTFTVTVSVPGTATPTSHTCTLTGTTATSFVEAILSANIPNVIAQVEAAGTISITHRAGGIITLTNTSSGADPVADAGFTSLTPGVVPNIVPGSINLTNWRLTTYTFSDTEPYTAPENGKLWYYNDPTQVDIMINDTTGWKGYKNVTRDARGYNLSATDPNGVIVSPTEPTTQTGVSGATLVPGDLWLDSSDLENYPKLYRYNNDNDWELIDNTDSVSQNGIVFADARWDASGTIDPITGSMPSVVSLQTSDYLDLDAPDYRLYPRGTLLFNTRRSGFIVKKFVHDYFNTQSFNVSAGQLPAQVNAWVSTVAKNPDGSPKMGHFSQREIVVQALKSAVDGNLDLREEAYNFTLLACPGYPELIPNLVSLNNDRANTGFIIGDTPMTLPGTINDITNYNTIVDTTDPYVGLFYPSAITNDLAGNEIAVPPSHMMLRTFLHSDNVSYQWFAPAGTRRGLIDNASNIGFLNPRTGVFQRTSLNQQIRDTLYELRINPITILPGAGIVAYGQKTRSSSVGGGGSSMDRINVARLVNYLRTVFRGVANQFLFEPNDKIIRDQIKQTVESILNDLVAKRGLYDYLVVCDTTNNTPDRIARNELYVDVAIEPMKDVEFIYIPIRLRNPGTLEGSSTGE